MNGRNERKRAYNEGYCMPYFTMEIRWWKRRI